MYVNNKHNFEFLKKVRHVISGPLTDDPVEREDDANENDEDSSVIAEFATQEESEDIEAEEAVEADEVPMEDPRRCVVCKCIRVVTIAYIYCEHVSCKKCAHKIFKAGQNCPVCRQRISNLLQTYI